MGTWRITFCLALLPVLFACGRHASPPAAVTEYKGDPTHRFDAEKVLNVYSWSNYIGVDTIVNFEKETGIKVHYDTYDNNEVLETKLLTGHTNYDIVIPTGTFFERQVQAGVFRKLDKAALPNLVNIDPDIMRRLALHDPGNLHAVPYLLSSTGLGFNVEQVRARLGEKAPDSWTVLFDPAMAAKLKDCGISILDAPTEVFSTVLIYLGRDANSRDPRDIAAASEVLRRIRPFVRYIDSAQYISDLANGSLCLSLGWSGDVMQARDRAREAANGVKIAYFVPREGALMTVDTIGIPADAPHPHNAEMWMNYLMRPDVIAGVTNSVKYPNGNPASLPFVKDFIKNDPSIYPDTATRARLYSQRAEPLEHSRLITREWTRFRTGGD